MKKTRVLFELPQVLKDVFDKKIQKTHPGLGFNPFLRAVLFFLSELQQPTLETILDQGSKLERNFERGDFKPGVLKVYGPGYSDTEKILYDSLDELIMSAFEPDDDQLSEAQAWWQEERERLKEELRDEIREELEKDEGE